jgi:hypothetical protein
MTDKVPSPSTPVAPKSTHLITELNLNDVLHGRGTGPNEFVGNQRFRSIVERRKDDYKSAPKNKMKTKIARDIMAQIHARGGRFRKKVESGKPVTNLIEAGVWCEVEESVALEKCRQALRQKREPSEVIGVRNNEEQGSPERNLHDVLSPAASLPRSSSGLMREGLVAPAFRAGQGTTALSVPPPSLTHVLRSTLPENVEPLIAAENLLLFQAAPVTFQQPTRMPRPMERIQCIAS